MTTLAQVNAASRPKCLDLFCGAGGAAMGLHRAGFDVTGVDINPQPRFPFRFVQGDALNPPFNLSDFDLIWASPPCQQYTPLRARQAWKEYPDHVAEVRRALKDSGKPYIIENVPGAPLGYYITLCGSMFGLRTYRHRRFETSWLMFQQPCGPHERKTSTQKLRRCFDRGMNISVTGGVGAWVGPACMGIDWMSGKELSQAIPPAYSEYIGRAAMRYLEAV